MQKAQTVERFRHILRELQFMEKLHAVSNLTIGFLHGAVLITV